MNLLENNTEVDNIMRRANIDANRRHTKCLLSYSAITDITLQLMYSENNTEIVNESYIEVCEIYAEEVEFIHWYLSRKAESKEEIEYIEETCKAVKKKVCTYTAICYLLWYTNKDSGGTKENYYGEETNLGVLIRTTVEEAKQLTGILLRQFKDAGGILKKERVDIWRKLR